MFLSKFARRDSRFWLHILVYCSIAAIVATLQYSVFTSFMRAASVVPQHIGGDFWITASGVECFDFPDLINEDYDGLVARYLPGASYRRVVFGFATWRSPLGKRGNVALVGVDGLHIPDNGFIVDRSDLARLDLDTSDLGEASIGDTTLSLAKIVDDLPTFLGVPYVLVPFETGRSILRVEPGTISYLVGDLPKNTALKKAAITQAANHFPEITLVPSSKFQRSSSNYWLGKTGAGLAILIAAILAGILMIFLLASGVLRFAQRYRTDLFSLLGHGVQDSDIALIITSFSLVIATGTFIITALVTPFIVYMLRLLLPWVIFHPIDLLVPFGVICTAFAVVIGISRRTIREFAPELVFRT